MVVKGRVSLGKFHFITDLDFGLELQVSILFSF